MNASYGGLSKDSINYVWVTSSFRYCSDTGCGRYRTIHSDCVSYSITMQICKLYMRRRSFVNDSMCFYFLLLFVCLILFLLHEYYHVLHVVAKESYSLKGNDMVLVLTAVFHFLF